MLDFLLFWFLVQKRGADFRHTSHGSPQTTFKYGKAAPVRVAVPIMKVCSYSYGGDCVTIEQYVFALICGMRLQKYTKYFKFNTQKC